MNGSRPDRQPDAWFLGIDLGTGSCKTVVVDQTARVLGFGASAYPSQEARPRWQEQNPQALVDGLVRSVRTALSQASPLPGSCAGISLGGALHSLLPLGRHGEPLGPIMTWADSRAGEQAQNIRNSDSGKDLYQRTGCPSNGMYPLYKLVWLRQEEPELFRQASRFVSAKEYVFHQLSGQYWVDYSLAAGSGLLNTHTLTWDDTALNLAGITPDKLSALGSPVQTFHGLRPELAAQLGISPGAPVTLGSSDAVNSSFGAGAIHPWQATCMIGTSGAFRVSSPHPVLDPDARIWCYAIDQNRWLAGGAINNGGIAFSWLRDIFNQANTPLGMDRQLTFEELLELAESVAPGSGGLICLPFFAGERSPNWNSEARAAFIGLSLEHRASHIGRSLLEGVAYRMRSLDELLAASGANVREIRASGGFTRSPLWLQILASVLNRELAVPAWGETSSLGAACWTLLASGHIGSLDDLGTLIAIKETYPPVQADSGKYQELYDLYCQLYQALAPYFGPVADLQSQLGQ
jgi:gluconokinase